MVADDVRLLIYLTLDEPRDEHTITDKCPLLTQSGRHAGLWQPATISTAVKSCRFVSAGSRIGNVGRSVAAHLAIDRRGLRLRWIEAVRCAVSIDVNGLRR